MKREEDEKIESQSCAEELWKECEPKIRAYCEFKLSSCPSEIDEVISQTYLALCIKIDDGRIINPRAWLYATLKNLIKITYDEQNKKKKNFISLDTYAKESHNLIYTTDFLDKKLSNDQIDILKAQIEAELDYEDLTLIHLVNEKHLKYKEIAKLMGTTESAVKQRAYRLRGKVKALAKEKIEKF